MEILDGIIAEDLFLYLPRYKVFIISDIHLGYEESLNRQGIFIPRNNYNDLLLRLEKALESIKKKYSVEKIILNGDIIHEFGKVAQKEKDLVRRFLGFLSKYGEIFIIVGNHDKMLKYFLDEHMLDKIIFGRIIVTHGDKLLPPRLLKDIDTIIIGHEHPSLTVSSGARFEKYKCFLKGEYSHKNILVMPSCNLFIEGTDMLREKALSPFLKKSNVLDFKAYIVEDKIYDFGKLKSLKNL
jgi:uncharacterized protein